MSESDASTTSSELASLLECVAAIQRDQHRLAVAVEMQARATGALEGVTGDEHVDVMAALGTVRTDLGAIRERLDALLARHAPPPRRRLHLLYALGFILIASAGVAVAALHLIHP